MAHQAAPTARKFPDAAIVALHEASVTATCMPIQLDDTEQWQAAIFYVMPPDAPALGKGNRLLGGPFSVSIEADLHEHEKGSMIEIAFEIGTPVEPSRGVLLFLTGHSSTHFDALKLLSKQTEIPLFIGDQYCSLLWQQRIPMNDAYRQGISSLIDEAVRRDAVIRLSGHYDPDVVFADIVASKQML